jgi:GR25 family glycosyltransferase involved in LPS biosynthesis
MSSNLNFNLIKEAFNEELLLENHKILIKNKQNLLVVDKASELKSHKYSLGTLLHFIKLEAKKDERTFDELTTIKNISTYFINKLNKPSSFLSINKIIEKLRNKILGNGFKTNLEIAYQIQNCIAASLIRTRVKDERKNFSQEEMDKNWNLNEYFGHIYVINLDDRPDAKDPTKFQKRLNRVKEDLEKIGGCSFERLSATYGAYDLDKSVWNRVDDNSFGLQGEELDRSHMGQAGCFMSHYRVIKDANNKYIEGQKELEEAQNQLKEAKSDQQIQQAQENIKKANHKVKMYSSILILEDDNGFGFVRKNKGAPATVEMDGAGVEFRKVMEDLPEDWDMLYLVTVECGKNGKKWMEAKSRDHSEHLKRLKYGLLTNAIAINNKAYPILMESLSKIDDSNSTFRPVDHQYALLHKKIKAFTPVVPLAYQQAGDSCITEGSMDEPWNGTWLRGF